ncbi:hypothetical protein IMG5_106500 [Ichthyophthirius multifiliis]|uniref:Casein kinase I n=1 Tax=Ichthyophthirius multifiliis TaxID=5932 RepID=G0QT73_ICHMU|nr:hypothetical protein IMG5_106500 [Ichthyophthirius multifiliis]EGR31598.1 hypothetical protein IMG5_106500 [Ichthyophthirius multifiliis]|eukprot:XP_004035084.1 hypothetical protein IMG5_106500 [Ichthyophthirius multifiliis]
MLFIQLLKPFIIYLLQNYILIILAYINMSRSAENNNEEQLKQITAYFSKNFSNIIIKEKIGQGSFGDIFKAFDTNLNTEVAIKLEKSEKEGLILKQLQGISNFPQLYDIQVKESQQYNYIEMSYLGPNLELLRKKQPKGYFTLKIILKIAIQMIEGLWELHKKGIIHRDIKPENFVIGSKGNRHKVLIIDFGLSKQYIEQNQHIPERKNKGLVGTARYTSINSHLGVEQSRRDDLEKFIVEVVLSFLINILMSGTQYMMKKLKYKINSVDGSCLVSLNETDLKDDLQIQNNIHRKKVLNCKKRTNIVLKTQLILLFQKGLDLLNEYSLFLKKNNINENQIIMSDYQKMQKQQEKEEQKIQFEDFSYNYNNNSTAIEIENNNNIQKKPLRIPNCDINVLNSSEDEIKQLNNIQDNIEIEKDQIQKELDYELIIEPVDGVQANFFRVKEQGAKIGRHSTNQILILEESISRFHAEIEFLNKEFYVRDKGSTTGTFIKIKEKLELKLGMVIEMGSNQFQISKILLEPIQMIQLTILEGLQFSQEMVLQCDYVSIGRKNGCKIFLPDDQHLSSIHAKIYFINQKFILEDQASTNGQTYFFKTNNFLIFISSWFRLSKEGLISDPYKISNNVTFKVGTTNTYNCKIKCEDKVQNINNNSQIINQLCIICYENDRNIIILPCRHNSVCIGCVKNIQVCPICRNKIADTIKIYKS